MSGSAANQSDIFDLRKLRRLAVLMNEQNLREIDLQQGELRVRLRRGFDGTGRPAVSGAQVAESGSARPVAPPPAAPSDEHIAVIKSPMVGTFYRASSPDDKPFISVGDHVPADTTICIIEAMKVFNEIPAEVSGKVIAVIVDNGEPVEFGQPLFRVDTRG